MRLPTLLLIVAFAATAVGVGWLVYNAGQDRREWAELRSLKNRDLYHARYEDRAITLVQKRLSRLSLPPAEGLVPWAILEVKPSGRNLCVLILELGYGSRSNAQIRCTAFSEDSTLLSSEVFGGGHLAVRTAQTRTGPLETDETVVEVACDRFDDSDDIARQYFALRNHRLVLLRLEDLGGKPAPNTYVGSTPAIGPGLPDRTDAEWETALMAEEMSEVLSALGWLAGTHVERNGTNVDRVSTVLDRPRVKERLLQLQKSSNLWIAQAARAVMHQGPPDQK
jgi:hypothetical protein